MPKPLRPEIEAFAQQIQSQWDDLDATPTTPAQRTQVMLATLGPIEPAIRRGDAQDARGALARFAAAMLRG
jgi:hypothetical protein